MTKVAIFLYFELFSEPGHNLDELQIMLVLVLL